MVWPLPPPTGQTIPAKILVGVLTAQDTDCSREFTVLWSPRGMTPLPSASSAYLTHLAGFSCIFCSSLVWGLQGPSPPENASLLHLLSTIRQSRGSHTRFRVALPNLPPRFQPLLHLLAHRHVELMLSEIKLVPSSVLCIFSLKPVLPVFPTSLYPSILLLSPDTRHHLCCFPFPHPHIQSLSVIKSFPTRPMTRSTSPPLPPP